MAVFGTVPHRVPARSAATPMASAAGRHGRNSICASRSCVVLPTVAVGILAEDIARQAMAGRAGCPAIRVRVTEAEALVPLQVMVEVAAHPAVVDPSVEGVEEDTTAAEVVAIQAVEAAAIPAAEVVVTLVVADMEGTARSVMAS